MCLFHLNVHNISAISSDLILPKIDDSTFSFYVIRIDRLTTKPIIRFSGIKGWKAAVLVPSDPSKSSEVKVEERLRHLIFTAETHNFPTGVAPFR